MSGANLAGMRDRLIHGYAGVDYLIVWDVAVTQAPELAAKLRHILQEHGPPSVSSPPDDDAFK